MLDALESIHVYIIILYMTLLHPRSHKGMSYDTHVTYTYLQSVQSVLQLLLVIN